MIKCFVYSVFVLLIFGCSPHSIRPFDEIQSGIPENFSQDLASSEIDIVKKPWWYQFEDEKLNKMMLDLFSENYSLKAAWYRLCLLYTSPSPRDQRGSRMPSSA